ncbi:MAG: HD domain-containing protein [Polyangiaceae bacterium]|jgi:GTP pyrophosphokinase|nr:HD domain-containing protein [Polyangiaceae bacterium]
MLVPDRIASAFALAAEVHVDHVRKGSGVAYLTHLMAVSALVGEHGGDEDLMIAALLHDVLEDRPDRVDLATIIRRFGWRVGHVVVGCSDCLGKPKPPWEQRKRAFLARLPGASSDVKLVVAADKLHNVSALLGDFASHGDVVWNKYNAPKERQCWYLRGCVEALRSGWSNDILEALDSSVSRLELACGLGDRD